MISGLRRSLVTTALTALFGLGVWGAQACAKFCSPFWGSAIGCRLQASGLSQTCPEVSWQRARAPQKYRHTLRTSVFDGMMSTNSPVSKANSITTFVKEGLEGRPALPTSLASLQICYRAHSIPYSCCCPWHYQDMLRFLHCVG